jgi:chromosome segregation ATPase
MSHRTNIFVISLITLVVLGLSLLTVAKAYSSSAQPVQSEQTLQTLLGEVRQLRLVLQRGNLNTHHAQITVERMKLQQQRVDRLQTQLGEVGNQLTSTRKSLSQAATYLKELEVALTRETDAAKRAEIEMRRRDTKFEVEEFTQKEQQQQGYETQLQAQLQAEQAKLNELNERLDTLQRELETLMSGDKPQPSGKRP